MNEHDWCRRLAYQLLQRWRIEWPWKSMTHTASVTAPVYFTRYCRCKLCKLQNCRSCSIEWRVVVFIHPNEFITHRYIHRVIVTTLKANKIIVLHYTPYVIANINSYMFIKQVVDENYEILHVFIHVSDGYTIYV